MKAYILSIAGVILLSAVVTAISPGGKMGKFVKGTMKLFILVVMVSPLVDWIRGKELPLAAPAKIEADGEYLQTCAEMLEERDEEEISTFLAENFSVSTTVRVSRAQSPFFPMEKISVILEMPGIYAEDERIHMVGQIKEELVARYGVETEVA